MSEQIYLPGACSVAIKCKDGVVLGNDNRVTSLGGYMVTSKNTKKIFKLTDKVATTVSGLPADFQTVVKIIVANANLYELREMEPMNTIAVGKMLANMLFQRKMAPYYVNTTIAGVDEDGPKLFTMDAAGSLMPDDWGVGGSAATMAAGVLEAEYTVDITVEEGIKLVEKVIRASVKRDAFSGNGIDILAITKDSTKEVSKPISELGE
ncbi:MAG: proteasome subunit beta [Candidatus Lokiarchaeota archaeon]|nr:proteasome subunit beta [Candidatus Lokiarchaeota archaeon]